MVGEAFSNADSHREAAAMHDFEFPYHPSPCVISQLTRYMGGAEKNLSTILW